MQDCGLRSNGREHFLMIMIMLIIRAPVIMFLDVPTKT